jgi:predicted Zn-dependent peptidase
MTHQDIVGHVTNYYVPENAVISIAGKIIFEDVIKAVEQSFGDWQGAIQTELVETSPPEGHHHIQHDSSQTQIGIVYPSIPYSHPDYFLARSAIGVLSDGMSSRLFTEVREKRGLCYTVYAMCHTIKNHGCVLAYAGTTTERAQETLDVMLAQIRRLGDGIFEDELKRLKARIKTGLIMQQESSSSRSVSMASDWHLLGRVRTLEELSDLLDQVNTEAINDYLSANPPQQFKVITLGQQALDTSKAEGGKV